MLQENAFVDLRNYRKLHKPKETIQVNDIHKCGWEMTQKTYMLVDWQYYHRPYKQTKRNN